MVPNIFIQNKDSYINEGWYFKKYKEGKLEEGVLEIWISSQRLSLVILAKYIFQACSSLIWFLKPAHQILGTCTWGSLECDNKLHRFDFKLVSFELVHVPNTLEMSYID